jgi:tRNA (mo5U34)-methyltransferase
MAASDAVGPTAETRPDRALVIDAVNAWYRGDVVGTIRWLQRVRERGTANPRVLYTLGLLHGHAGDLDAGRTLVEAATAERPGVLPLVPPEGLIEVLDRLSRSVDNATVRVALANAHAACGRHAEARRLSIDLIRSLRRGRDYAAPPGDGLTEEAVRSAIAPQPLWHSIDLGGDLFVDGDGKPPGVLALELLRMHIPDVTGKTVLDVGAFGGFHSFEMERRGARQVTALDYYSWVTDFEKLHAWSSTERALGRIPDNYAPPPHVFDERGQPGRRALDVARAALGSRIVPVCGLLERSTDLVGRHDIVLYLGVLYHTKDPFGALRCVAEVCNELAIIETLGVVFPGHAHRPVWEFYRDDAVNDDKSTWWAPSDQGLHHMLLAAGFRRVDILYGADTAMHLGGDERLLTRIFAHAYK